MSYVVLGCGAIGAAIAAGLVRDRHEVLVCDADPAVVRAVREHGLRVEGPGQAFSAAVAAVEPGAMPARIDGPVLVAVRAQDTAAAAAILAGRLHGAGYVLSVQAGLSALELAAAIGEHRVVAGQACFAAVTIQPGVVRCDRPPALMVGELDGTVTARVAALAADIAGARATRHILGGLHAGRARAAVLAAAAVSGLPAAGVLEDPAYGPLLDELSRQVWAASPAPPPGPAPPPPAPGRVVVPTRWPEQHECRTHAVGLGVGDGWAREVGVVLEGVEGELVRRLVELAGGIVRGRRSPSVASLGLLAAYERLERLARPLNAVASVASVTDPAPGAGAGESRALAGEPVAIKDIIAVAGLPTRCGSPASDPRPAQRDAALVSRLRAAGAEVFATTQCLEYAAGFAHPEVGDTRNPRDPSRTSGGSSGGSAAVVAAGVCGLAIGTDTGGSIRIPAAYCGVIGFKPTYGLIPLDGVFPLSPSCDHAGTLTATVAGAVDLLNVLAGPGPRPEARPGFTIGLLAPQLADPSVTAEVRDVLLAALDRLAGAGWEIRELAVPWLEQLAAWEDTLTTIVAREASEVHRDRDQIRYAEGTRALLAFGAGVGDREYAEALRRRAELAEAIESSLNGVAALAGPTVGFPAPEQDPPFGADADHGEGRFTGPYNLSGHPAVSLPVPTAGRPAGLQLAGRRGGDRALLQVAAAAESILTGAESPADRRKPQGQRREN